MAVSKSLDVNGKLVTINIDYTAMPFPYALRDNLKLQRHQRCLVWRGSSASLTA
jgi:hypothetical protein